MLNIILLENCSHFVFVRNNNISLFLKQGLFSEKNRNKIKPLEGKVEDEFIPFRVKGNVCLRTGHEGSEGE
jgi:hypothetical protein